MVEIVNEDKVIQEVGDIQNVLTERFWEPISGATPSVENRTHLFFSATSAVTNFSGGQEAQTIKVLGEGLSSIIHGTSIQRSIDGRLNPILQFNIIYTFTFKDEIWYEDAGGFSSATVATYIRGSGSLVLPGIIDVPTIIVNQGIMGIWTMPAPSQLQYNSLTGFSHFKSISLEFSVDSNNRTIKLDILINGNVQRSVSIDTEASGSISLMTLVQLFSPNTGDILSVGASATDGGPAVTMTINEFSLDTFWIK